MREGPARLQSLRCVWFELLLRGRNAQVSTTSGIDGAVRICPTREDDFGNIHPRTNRVCGELYEGSLAFEVQGSSKVPLNWAAQGDVPRDRVRIFRAKRVWIDRDAELSRTLGCELNPVVPFGVFSKQRLSRSLYAVHEPVRNVIPGDRYTIV